MHIFQVTDPEFRSYGKIAEGFELGPLLEALRSGTPCPEDGVVYVPSEPALQELPDAKKMAASLFGGLPVQFGWCNGHNAKLNCLEYHRSGEFNLGTEDFILLLAKREELDEHFCLDTERVKAFLVPAGTLVELYAETLHYAPCQAGPGRGFRVLVVLPEGTNGEKPEVAGESPEDGLLAAANKWLIAHAESREAESGARVGLRGKNIDISGALTPENPAER